MSPIILKVNPANRLELATTIQNLIDMLDAIDGDADFEPNLGANEHHPLGSWMWDRDDTGSHESRHLRQPTIADPPAHRCCRISNSDRQLRCSNRGSQTAGLEHPLIRKRDCPSQGR